MPHIKPKENEFVRRNGNYSLKMIADSNFGLPYGSIPRLVMACVCTEAIMFDSQVVLSQKFFEEILSVPVPVDMRALRALKGSPMAVDIYSWLTYRAYNLKRRTTIPWEGLKNQFGADCKNPRLFKSQFLKHLKSVLAIYPEAKVEAFLSP